MTEIVQERFGGNAHCISVRITEDLGDGYYKAVATLENGTDRRILLEKRNDVLSVTVLPLR